MAIVIICQSAFVLFRGTYETELAEENQYLKYIPSIINAVLIIIFKKVYLWLS